MNVQVRLFATLRDAAGTEECCLALGPAAQGFDAKAALVARYPRLRGLVEFARLALNQEYQPWETPLHDGDKVRPVPRQE